VNETERWAGKPEPRGAGDQIRRQAEAAASLQESARSAAGSAGDAISAAASSGKDQIAARVANVAHRLDGSADELRRDEAWLAELIGQGAQRLGRLADELRDQDVRGLLQQVEEFGRREPAIFAGAAVALGFALTRLARASSPPQADTGRPSAGATGGVGATP
jgi:hypothetical protein